MSAETGGVTAGPAQPVAETTEALVAASSDAVIAVDAAGAIVLANLAVEELFGYAPDELIGRQVELLVPAALRAGHVERRGDYMAHPRARPMGAGLHLLGLRRDGTEIAIDVALAPVPHADGPLLYAAFVRDATERRRTEASAAAVNEISQALLGGATTDTLWAMTARHARQLGRAAAGLIVSAPDGAGQMIVSAGDGDGSDGVIGRAYPFEGTFAEEVLRGTARVALTDLSVDPRAPEVLRALDLGCTVAVVIAGSTRQFGTLLVGRRRGDAVLSEADVAAIETFADSAAVAFDLGEARADLERLGMVEEHDRIARDLHDTVIQRLFATGMSLSGVQRLTTEPVSSRIAQAVEELDDTIREIRSTIFELQEPIGGGVGLRRQVKALAAEVAPRLGFTPRVAFDGPVDTMAPTAVTTHVLAVVREALSNVVRHSQAHAVEVVLSFDGDDLVLVVADDGVGPPDGPRAGSGLRNMASRAESLGGRFAISAREPTGSVLEWRVPVR